MTTSAKSGPLLKIDHLEVKYGDLIGVADVSLEVPKGSVVALLGSNGAGKTTTLNAIAGTAVVSAGSVTFAGENIAGQPAYAIVRKGLALSPERTGSSRTSIVRGATQHRYPSRHDSAATHGSNAARTASGSGRLRNVSASIQATVIANAAPGSPVRGLKTTVLHRMLDAPTFSICVRNVNSSFISAGA